MNAQRRKYSKEHSHFDVMNFDVSSSSLGGNSFGKDEVPLVWRIQLAIPQSFPLLLKEAATQSQVRIIHQKPTVTSILISLFHLMKAAANRVFNIATHVFVTGLVK
ncbi:uncharacterized protein LOC135220981 [Macrobrachium nipponense]|uniref:uncharacterized protein LOC135220981 n=1 Tax=Macrobrachium nipponense TaxID=159736 RepID=UPI0030C8CF07